MQFSVDDLACRIFSIEVIVLESDTLKWICRKNGSSDFRSLSNRSCRLTCVVFSLSTAMPSRARTIPRNHRSMASARRMNALRSALPRSSTGASSAGPVPCGSPST